MTTFRAAIPPARAHVPASQSAPSVYYPALDGLRALAFLMVFADHYLYIPWAWSGVDLFFVLSGFLITGLLYDSRRSPRPLANFYRRRALRIFPLFFAVIAALLLADPIFHWQWSWRWLAWPLYLGNFLRGLGPIPAGSPLQMLADAQPLSRTFPHVQLYLGHLWSLCIEEQFYLIWPFVVLGLRGRRRLLSVCLAFLVLCPLLRQVASHTLPRSMLQQQVLYRWTPFRIDALLLGAAIALLLRGPSARILLPVARALFATLASAALVWLALHHASLRCLGYVYPPWALTWGLFFIDLLAASLLVLALDSGSRIYRALSLRPLRRLGRISYGAYVFHDIFHLPIVHWVAPYAHSHWQSATAAVGMAVTLALATVSYRWLETPFLRLKDRLATAQPIPPQSAESPVTTPIAKDPSPQVA